METTKKDIETEIKAGENKTYSRQNSVLGIIQLYILNNSAETVAEESFTCFHPQSLCDVTLLWRRLCGGGKRGYEDAGGLPGRVRSGKSWRECPPAGLSPRCCGGRPPGDGCRPRRGGGDRLCVHGGDSWGRRGRGGVFSFGG